MPKTKNSTIDLDSARIQEEESLYQGWYKFSRLAVQMPDGAVVERHLVEHGPGAAVLPYDLARKFCVVIKQPRAPLLKAGVPAVYEAIAGSLDGSPAEACIVKEALEEAGLKLRRPLEFVANIWPMVTISTERVALFLCEYSADDFIASGGGAQDEHENIEVHEVSFDDLRSQVISGQITDAKTLILAQALMLRVPLGSPGHESDIATAMNLCEAPDGSRV